MSAVQVHLYGRPDCHLCDEARESIARMGEEEGLSIDLTECDIESDPELFRRYLERIPVVMIRGEIVSELIIDTEAVRGRIARLAAEATSQ